MDKRALRARARGMTGPRFRSNLVCQNCGAEAEAIYQNPPERFRCPSCGRLACIRDDGEEYPSAMQPLPM